jgi:hypothetical protein
MLELAIKSRIPVIRVRTTDLLNLPQVLAHLAPDMNVQEASNSLKADLSYAVAEFGVNRHTYDTLAENSRVLLLVNQGEECPYAFDAGEVPVPRELMENLLQVVAPKNRVSELLPCFNGLTLKQMAEVIRLTEARDKSLTPRGVMQVRSMLAGKLRGLDHVDTKLPLYLCPAEVKSWVSKNKQYFLEAKDDRLVPRGILFNGDPGVGKAMASKYIANEFGVPLYRLDLSSVLGKWVGDSEAGFARALNTLDQEEPAILLIDEVEKVFAATEDQGTTSRLLSQLLWWLAEHKSRVLTAMTTNAIGKLPQELYRAGRIDQVVTIPRPTVKEAETLALAALDQYVKVTPTHRKELLAALMDKFVERKRRLLSHAEITHLVVDTVKDRGWLTISEKQV